MPWMSENIFRNLLSRPATRLYPAVKREPPAGARGQIVFHAARCEFCGDCERACPTQAIVLDTEWGEGGETAGAAWNGRNDGAPVWVRLYDPFRCILCNLCVEACAYGALSSDGHHLAAAYTRTITTARVQTW
ncbi:MAG: 4Fe-4S dicluster domain-containing protein [Bacillota bacterium]